MWKIKKLIQYSSFCQQVDDWMLLKIIEKIIAPYDGLYGKAPAERGTFSRLRIYERVGILLVEAAYERVGKSVI